jgi:hypothetical protein
MTADAEGLAGRSALSTSAVTPGSRGVFAALWLLWAVLLATAMIWGSIADRHGEAMPTACRMASSVVLVVAGWWAFARGRWTRAGRFSLGIAVGMTLGAIGDFFNAGLLDFVPLVHGTLGGIAAFGLGHMAYIGGCWNLRRELRLADRRAMWAAVLFWQLFGLVAWYFVVFLGSENRSLVGPALPYSLLLAGTAGVAAGLALQERRLAGLATGAALFLASDLILACGLFRGSFPYQTQSVWLTYGPGQMLIVFATVTAASLLADRKPPA